MGNAPDRGAVCPHLLDGCLEVPEVEAATDRRPLLWPKTKKLKFCTSNAMKTKSTTLKLADLLACAFLAAITELPAQEASIPIDTSRLVPSARVMVQSTVRQADGSLLTMQRIEPPTAEQLAQMKAAQDARVAQQAAEAAAARASGSLPGPMRSMMLVTARVYEGSLTEVQWNHDGRLVTAWSSVDFNLLSGVQRFETGGSAWGLLSLTSTRTRALFDQRVTWLQATGAGQLPVWPVFPQEVLAVAPPGKRAWYVLKDFAGSAAEADAACLELDALHAYVEANYEALVARRAQREAAAAAAAAELAANPPPPAKPKDTIIQFWKVETPPPNPPPSPTPTPTPSGDAATNTTNGEVQP